MSHPFNQRLKLLSSDADRLGMKTKHDIAMTMDVRALNALLKQGLPPNEALASGRVTLNGDPEALERSSGYFRLGQQDASGTRVRSSGAPRGD